MDAAALPRHYLANFHRNNSGVTVTALKVANHGAYKTSTGETWMLDSKISVVSSDTSCRKLVDFGAP